MERPMTALDWAGTTGSPSWNRSKSTLLVSGMTEPRSNFSGRSSFPEQISVPGNVFKLVLVPKSCKAPPLSNTERIERVCKNGWTRARFASRVPNYIFCPIKYLGGGRNSQAYIFLPHPARNTNACLQGKGQVRRTDLLRRLELSNDPTVNLGCVKLY